MQNTVLLLALVSIIGHVHVSVVDGYEFKCPQDWLSYGPNCYRFTRLPELTYEEAKERCSAFNAFLLSVLSNGENAFITDWLLRNDPVHVSWYTSANDVGNNVWRWDVPLSSLSQSGSTSGIVSASGGGRMPVMDGNGQFSNREREYYSIISSFWLPQEASNTSFDNFNRFGKNSVFNFSQSLNRWGLVRINGNERASYICKMKREDVSFANAVEKNIDYGVNVLEKFRIPRGPKFIREPESVVFDVSGRSSLNFATLKCVAEGYPTPTYKWYKEEYTDKDVRSILIDPLSDRRYTQTDGILIIYNPNADNDRGKYHCMSENQFGKIISKTVQLTFGYIGEFTKKRSPDYGREFWGKSISCDPPKHHPTVSYHWSRDSFEYIIEDDRRLFVSRDGNLYFSSLEKIDRANYSCNVKSSIASSGRTGPFFPLIVDSASSSQKLLFPNHFPKIFPDIKLAGKEVRLECMAYGYPVPYYNWTRVGITDRMPEGSFLTSYNRVLIISNAKVQDSGEYRCTATSGKEVISKSVQLSIQSLPVILQEIGNKIVERTVSNLAWECEAYGIPSISYTWFKDGREISDNAKANGIWSEEDKNRYLASGRTFTILGVIPERDQGIYQCKATNELGTTFSSGQLRIVQLAPTFQKHPMAQEMFAAEGGNITIPCVPEALPVPSFEWQKDYNRLSIGGRIRVLPNGFLVISPVHRMDEGKYTCVARNPLGTARTEGMVKVFSKPSIYVRPNPIYERQVGESIELPCRAYMESSYHNLDIAYVWHHNGLRIDRNKMPQYSLSIDGSLIVNNLTLAEIGDYECVVTSAVGSASAATRLLLYAQPGPPGAVLADDITATSARLHWSDGSDYGRSIHGYRIEGITNHNERWEILLNSSQTLNAAVLIAESGRKTVRLANLLSPWSTYRFRVRSYNELGMSEPSEPSPSYNTDKAQPFKAPANVNGGGGNTGTLTIMWDPLPPKDWNAPDIWYRIYYRSTDSFVGQPYIDKNLTHLGNINMYTVNVGDDNFYKQYEVRVQAMNSVGAGLRISEPVMIYSAEAMPQIAPNQVYATAYNSTALNITWMLMDLSREKMRGRLIGHRIKYWKLGQEPQLDSLTLLKRGTDPWSLIVGLMPDTEYYIAVMAYNEAGAGPESEPFLARTYKAAPQQPPTSVNITAIDQRSVMVKWRGISVLSNAEEPIQGYKVRFWESDTPIAIAKEVYKYLDGGDLQTIITGLTPGTTYKLRVLAFSAGGDGKMSSQWEFKVGESSTLSKGSAFGYTQTNGSLKKTIVCIPLLMFIVFNALKVTRFAF